MDQVQDRRSGARPAPRPRAAAAKLTRASLALVLALAAFRSPAAAQADTGGGVQGNDPVADPRAVVTVGDARFTVLTPQLIRMEWAPSRRFEDRPSLVFVNRRLPVPAFRSTREGDWQRIETDALTLRYRVGGGRFNPQNLELRLKVSPGTTWRPGMPDTANLLGTTRTLDGASGAVKLEPGLVSRDGWVVVDDGERPLFDATPWPWVLPRPKGTAQDLYFFGYGHDYRKALGDFTRVAGRIPMPPRFAFGAWWSRYWAYTDQEFEQLVRDFGRNDVPLDVLVIDMDWHFTAELRWEGQPKDQAGQPLGWTGYTWDRAYFPDPVGFLAWVGRQGLRRTLNLHPASGIQPHEEQYPAMARAMGIDPATKRYVPFEIESKRFANAYFQNVIHPLERQGIDFFWLDWQQWAKTSIPGLNPTWWINYTFFTDMQREGRARPLIFHRWGGLGNHRYEIGFSGDTHAVWPALAFEPYFTATAANVGYAYWSHDIGGHIHEEGKGTDPELYTRWVQFGIFSPVLRTHTTKNAAVERRIWAYPIPYANAMRDAFNLRYQLVPYIYTASRKTYDTGVAMLRPLYYDWPDAKEAYDFTGEYMFGDDMLVSPVVAPMSADTLLATRRVWLPPGEWYEWWTGTSLRGPAVVERTFSLDQVPVWVRAGAIVPMQEPTQRVGDRQAGALVLAIFPGADGATRLYEDVGNSTGYQGGEFAHTPVRQHRDATGALHVEILPAEGSFPGMPRERAYEIRLPGTLPPAEVIWQGVAVPHRPAAAAEAGAATPATASAAAAEPSGGAAVTAPGWRYDGDQLATIVTIPPTSTGQRAELVIRFRAPAGVADPLLDGVPGRLHRLYESMTMLEALWPDDWPPDAYVALVQTGNRIGLRPDSAEAELRRFRDELPGVLARVRSLKGDARVIDRALTHLGVPGTGRASAKP